MATQSLSAKLSAIQKELKVSQQCRYLRFADLRTDHPHALVRLAQKEPQWLRRDITGPESAVRLRRHRRVGTLTIRGSLLLLMVPEVSAPYGVHPRLARNVPQTCKLLGEWRDVPRFT